MRPKVEDETAALPPLAHDAEVVSVTVVTAPVVSKKATFTKTVDLTSDETTKLEAELAKALDALAAKITPEDVPFLKSFVESPSTHANAGFVPWEAHAEPEVEVVQASGETAPEKPPKLAGTNNKLKWQLGNLGKKPFKCMGTCPQTSYYYHSANNCWKCEACCKHNVKHTPAHPDLQWSSYKPKYGCETCQAVGVYIHLNGDCGIYGGGCQDCCYHNLKLNGISVPEKLPAHPDLYWANKTGKCGNCTATVVKLHYSGFEQAHKGEKHCFKCQNCCPHNKQLNKQVCICKPTHPCETCNRCTDCMCQCWTCEKCEVRRPWENKACANCKACDKCCACVSCYSGSHNVYKTDMCTDCGGSLCNQHCKCAVWRRKGYSTKPGWVERGYNFTPKEIPIDYEVFAKHCPPQAMADYYLLGYMKLGEGTAGNNDPRKATGIMDEVVWEAGYEQDQLVQRTAPAFSYCMDFSIGGELRHHEMVCQWFGLSNRRTRTQAWEKWLDIRRRVGPDALKDAAKLFREMPSRSIGGERWAVAADTLYEFVTGKMPAWLFLDRVFTMQHNGGSILNKVSWNGSATPMRHASPEHCRQVGDAHHSNPTNLEHLLMMSSSTVSSLFDRWWKARNLFLIGTGQRPELKPNWQKFVDYRDYYGEVRFTKVGRGEGDHVELKDKYMPGRLLKRIRKATVYDMAMAA